MGEGSGGRLEETKRVTRVLLMLALIGNGPRRWTRRALAERLEISERQIDKDLAVIRHGLGYELRRSREGYYFERAPELRAVHYTAAEALALIAALQLARGSEAIDAPTLASALARTEGALPAALLPLARGLRRLGDGETPQGRHRVAVLGVVQEALAVRRCLAVEYETASRGAARSERVLRPYGLEWRGGGWLLIAHDSLRGLVRDFRVDRIVRAALLGERYEIPADFDAAVYRGGGWGVLRETGGEPREVLLRFTAEEGRRARDQAHHASQREEVQADGTVLMRFRVGITSELVRWVFRWGTGCEVLAPPELRALVAEQARTVAAMHQGEGE